MGILKGGAALIGPELVLAQQAFLMEIERRGILKDSDFEQFKKAVKEAGDSREAARAHLHSLAELQRWYEKEHKELLLQGELDYRQRIEDLLAAVSRREEELADALQQAKSLAWRRKYKSLRMNMSLPYLGSVRR